MFQVKVVLVRPDPDLAWAPVEVMPKFHEFMGLMYNAPGLNDQTTEVTEDGLQATFTHTWDTKEAFDAFQAENKSVVDDYVDSVTAYYTAVGIDYRRTTETV